MSSLLLCMLSKARCSGQPGWLGSDYWKELIVVLGSPEFQKKSSQAKATQNSKKGDSLHTCDSVSMETTKSRLEASLGRSTTHEECGLQGIGSSAIMSDEQLDEMR
ncbi:hypothetical protein FXO38_34129 [Capsicum annuum]|nr:hypothetical protein FXO38_34129 [Capsicum annuum]